MIYPKWYWWWNPWVWKYYIQIEKQWQWDKKHVLPLYIDELFREPPLYTWLKKKARNSS